MKRQFDRSHEHRATRILGRPLGVACLCAALSVGVVVLSASGAKAAPNQWAVTPSPNNLAGGNGLVGVSCTSQSFCLALGRSYTDGSGAEDTVVEQWDGSAWTLIPGPSSPAGSPSYTLSSISCGTPTYCVAVGTVRSPTAHITGLQSQSATWDGTNWTMAPPGISLNGSALYGVACIGANDCLYVGVHWDADDFPIGDGVFSPAPIGLGAMTGVSCSSTGFCMEIGYWNDFGSTVGPSVAVSGSGAPASVTAPPVSGRLGSVVACSGPTFCMIPGYAWNGSTWATVASPGAVTAMTCASATDCVAVGGQLIEAWDGTAWTTEANPSPTANLSGLSCTSSTSCWAVGGDASGSLILRSISGPLPLSISTPSPLPNATLGSAYSLRLTAQGGTAPYTFSRVGAFPRGLGLRANGQIFGTPRKVGTYPVVVRVVDRARPRDTSTKTLWLQVAYVGPILVRSDGAAAVTSANPSASVTLTPGSRGDLLVAYIATFNTAAVSVSGGGLNWIPAGSATDPTVGDGGLLSLWEAREPSTSPPLATTVVSAITGNGPWAQTLDVVAYAGASGIGALGGGNGPSSQTPSLSLWPEAGGSLIGIVGFDPDSASVVTPGANQVLDLGAVDTVENAQMWFQHWSLSTIAGQEITVGDSLSPPGRWDLEAVEILPQNVKPLARPAR